LCRTETIGPITFYAMLHRFGSARAALDMVPQLARRGERSQTVTPVTRAAAEAELAALSRAGARMICRGEPLYPSALAAIEDAPPILTVLGRAESLTRPIVAIVGARNASAIGRRISRELAASLGEAGIVVVSGLARGIDAAAHLGALETGSVAVVAGGVDVVVYPEENRGLHEALARQGAILAELPLGTEPQARHFPRRNRIISGMALGVVVVEAAARSGSLITARCALDQGRDVFAVPGSPRGCAVAIGGTGARCSATPLGWHRSRPRRIGLAPSPPIRSQTITGSTWSWKDWVRPRSRLTNWCVNATCQPPQWPPSSLSWNWPAGWNGIPVIWCPCVRPAASQ
jgi:DNA processing protein